MDTTSTCSWCCCEPPTGNDASRGADYPSNDQEEHRKRPCKMCLLAKPQQRNHARNTMRNSKCSKLPRPNGNPHICFHKPRNTGGGERYRENERENEREGEGSSEAHTKNTTSTKLAHVNFLRKLNKKNPIGANGKLKHTTQHTTQHSRLAQVNKQPWNDSRRC